LANQCTPRTWLLRWANLKELPSSNVLQKLNLSRCANLKKLPSSIGELNAFQKFYLRDFSSLKALWKRYIHLWASWMHSKCFIYQGVPTWNKYFHLLVNWVHSKSFICQIVLTWKNHFHLLVIECIWKSWFVWTFQLAKITYMYIGQLNALQKI
jgi:hypothetical protein